MATGDNEEIFRRLAAAEKEIYHMSRQLTTFENEKPIQRLSMVELSVKQIASDLVSMEKISIEMSEKLTKGLDELKIQGAAFRAQMAIIVGAGSFIGATLAAWPILKEILKAMVA